MKDTKEQKIIWQIYKEMYAVATPPCDFEELVNSAEENELGQRVIHFSDYEISQEDYEEILKRNLVGKRLTKLKQQAIRNSIARGVSPKFSAKNLKTEEK